MRDPQDDIDMNALAARLQGWRPSAGGLDRDRLIFESGRAAGLAEARARFRRQFWPLATAASLLLATVGFLLARQQVHEQREAAEAEVAVADSFPLQPTHPIPAIEPIDPNSYLALARRFASGDVDPIQAAPVRPSESNRSSPSVDQPPPLRARDFDRLLNL
jgi:hypothetical protein